MDISNKDDSSKNEVDVGNILAKPLIGRDSFGRILALQYFPDVFKSGATLVKSYDRRSATVGFLHRS